jgi:hypothetical protein
LCRGSESALAEAATLTAETLQSAGLSAGFRCWAHILSSQLARRQGQLEQAVADARRALELSSWKTLRGLLARRVLIEALLERGLATEAQALAEELAATIDHWGSAGQAEVGLWLAVATARAAAADPQRAAQAINRGQICMHARAAHISEPPLRERYLLQVSEHIRLRELAAKLDRDAAQRVKDHESC